jgi:8-oxo-dGTP diphosphatase
MAKKQTPVVVPISPVREQALKLASKADKTLGYNQDVVDKLGVGAEGKYAGLQSIYKQQDADIFDPYEDYVDRGTLHGGQFSMEDLGKIRAQNQSNWQQAGHAIGRVAVNIVPQIAGGLSSMVDIPGYFSAEEAANNQLVNWAQDLKKEVDEDWFPIYEENPGQSMSLSDPAWWFARGSGLVESMGAFAVTGMVGGKIASTLLKGAGKLSGAKTLTRAIVGADKSKKILGGASALTNATMMNQAEATISATQVFNDTYEARLAQGWDRREAKEAASEAAAATMNLNKINILLNLSSAAAFLKPIKSSRDLIRVSSGLGKVAELAKEGGQESLEELINLVAEKAGTAKGKGEEYTLKDALNDMGSMEGFEAAFLGALGGIGQTGITKATEYSKYGAGNTTDEEGNRISKVNYERNQYAKQQEIIEDLKSKGVKVTDVMKDFKDSLLFQEQLINADKKGDTAEVEKLKEQMFENQAIKAFQSGTTEVLENLYKAEAERNPEEVGQDYIARANDAIVQLQELESIYNNFEEYENVDEIFFNRANKNRIERNLKYVETLKKESDFNLSKDLHSISKKYTYDREREILIKEDGKVVRTETAIDKVPLSYSTSNLEENQGRTEEERKVYDKFLEEVKALPSYQAATNYGEELDKMQSVLASTDKEFATITSKEYQSKVAEKKAKQAAVKEAYDTIKNSNSIAEVEKLRDSIEDPEFKKAAELKLDEIKKSNDIAAKQKRTTLQVKELTSRINSAASEDLQALRQEVEDAELSQDHKTNLNQAIDKRIKVLNGEEVEEEDEEDNPLGGFDSKDPAQLANEVEEENKSFETTLPPDLPNPNTEKESVESEVADAAAKLTQEDKTMVIGEDSQGNLVYGYQRSAEGYNRGAFLSREFNQTEAVGRVDRDEMSNTLEDNLEILDPDFLTAGTELSLQVDTEYEGDKYDPTSNTREKISWNLRLLDLQKQADAKGVPLTELPEYIAEVPIKVTTKEGDTVFYVHDNAWYREENLDATAEEIAEDKARNYKIRETIVKKGMPVKSKVTYKSFGKLFKSYDNKAISVSEAMPDPNLILGIGKNGAFELSGDVETVLNGGTILNSEVSDGRLYAIVKVGPKEFLPIPLERNPITQETIDTVMFAIEGYLSGDPENPVVKAIAESSLGLDITTHQGLSDYLSQFIYLFPTQGPAGLENYLIQGGQGSTLKSNMPLISVGPTGIEFGRPGVNMGSYLDKNNKKVTKCAIKISPNFKSKGGQATNSAGLSKLRVLLEDPRYTPLAHAKRESIAKEKDAVFLLDAEGATRTMSYADLLKASHKTNILSVNIGTEDNPKWVYTIQPTILFDTAFAKISSSKKAKAATPKVKVTPAQKSSLRYKGVNPTVDVIVTRVVNGETQVLVIKRGATAKAEPNKLAFPGGFHDTNAKPGNKWRPGKETAAMAAVREVKEETGLDLDGLTLEKVGVFDDQSRDPRNSNTSWISSTVYKVAIPEDFSGSTEVSGKDDAQDARWIPVSELSAMDKSQFGFDHADILESEGLISKTSVEDDIEKRRKYSIEELGITEGVDKKIAGLYISNNLNPDGTSVTERISGGSIEEVKNKINAKYDAELAAIKSQPSNIDIESRKANIQKRKNAALKSLEEAEPITEEYFEDNKLVDPNYVLTEEDKASIGKYQFDLDSESESIEDTVQVSSKQEGIALIEAKYNAELTALEQKPTAEQEVETLTGEALIKTNAEDILKSIEDPKQLEAIVENIETDVLSELELISMGFGSKQEAIDSFKMALEIYRENQKDSKTITLPNGLKITVDKNTKDTNKLSEDEIDELITELTPEQIDAQRKEIEEMIIRGIDTQTQSSLIAYLSSDIIQESLKVKDTGSLKTVEVKPILDKHLEAFKELSRFYKEQGLDNKAARLDSIIDQFDKVRRLVNQNMSKFSTGEVSEKLDLDATTETMGLVRTAYTDDWSFTLNPKSTTSEDLKKFLSLVQAQDEDGPITNMLGLPEILPYDTVFETLSAIMANKPADYKLMISILELNQEKFPWLKSVVDLLEAAPEKIKNEFVSGMTRHNINMQFIMWSKDKNGNYSLQKWSSNSSSIEQRIKSLWNSNLKGLGTQSNLVAVNEDDEYIFNPTVVKALVAEAAEFAKNPAVVTNDDLANWLGNFGIVLSDKTYEDLRKGKFNNKGKKSWAALFTNSAGLVKVLSNTILKNSAEEINLEDSKLMNDSVVKALAKLEASNNLNTFSNSFQAGGKTVFSYGNNNYLVNRMRDLTSYDETTKTFVNQDLIDKLKTISFTRNSGWLSDLTNEGSLGDMTRNTLRIDYLSLEALKKAFTKSQDNRKLNNLTTAEHEVVKIGFFQNAAKDEFNKETRRAVNFLYPTMSDKTTMLTVAALSRELILEDGEISTKNLETLYDAVVVPEINRIRDKQSKNIKGAEPNYFYFFHTLNNLMIEMGVDVQGNVTEKSFLDIVKDKDDTINSPEVKAAVMEEIRSIFNTLLDSKIEDWTKLGIGLKLKDANGRVTDNYTFMDKEYMSKVAKMGKGTDKVRYAAMDYVFNYLIANAEAHKLFAGDPALYAKFKSKEGWAKTLEVSPDTLTDEKVLNLNLAETFTNLGKRLAGDIAPGMELANSKNNKYYQVFLKDKEIDSNNVKDSAQKEYFSKIIDKFGKNYSNIEGSDAQEYTTWKEHLYVMRQLGRLTQSQYDKLYVKLKAQSMGDFRESNKLSYDEIGIIMQPLKPVYVGNDPSIEDNADRRVYIKSSSFPLIPELTVGMQIDKVRAGLEKFEAKVAKTTSDGNPTFVRASFGTANKVGAVSKAAEVFDSNGNVVDNFEISDENTLLLARSNFRIQQDVPYKREKDSVNIGTQERKLLFVNTLDLEIEPGVTGEDLMKLYNENYEDLYEYAFEDLSEKLGLVEEVSTKADLASVLSIPDSTVFDQVQELQDKIKDAGPIQKAQMRQDFAEEVGNNTLERVNFINKNFDEIVNSLIASGMPIFKDENNEFKNCQ